MRQSLLQTFSEIYILDLHGNSKKKEAAPDSSTDKNVFDIQQGVAIGIFVKQPGKVGPAKIYHADLWGTRENKYAQLFEQDVIVTEWKQIEPQSPFYLFAPQNVDLLSEYNHGWKITDVFPTNSAGIVTARDHLSIHWTEQDIWKTVQDFAQLPVEEARVKYDLREDVRDWKVNLAQTDIKSSGPQKERIHPILYRPFDIRHTYYTGQTRGFHCMPRSEVMSNVVIGENLGLITTRQVTNLDFCHVLCSRYLIELKVGSHDRSTNLFPLYLYPTDDTRKQTSLFDVSPWPPDIANNGRVPNLAPAFVEDMAQTLGLTFQPFPAVAASPDAFTPEDIFHYIYAIFHSPTYRARYAEFLKIDFPRMPLTSDAALFRRLCALGQELVALHLLETPAVQQFITRYPIAGDDTVAKGYPKYTPPIGQEAGRVYINKTQYFSGIAPELWEFQIGGYQVLDKWLKDRRGRVLSYEELTHYQKTAVALQQTMTLMEQIDEAIPEWPIV